MSILVRFIKKLISLALALALGAALFAAAVLGWQGWRLYIKASAAQPVGSLYETIQARSDFVSYDELPETYIDAVISVEDKRFMKHGGVDVLAVARAAWTDIRTRSLTEGGSTITQQLAKNELFTQEKNFARKAAEVFAARDIEKVYTKREIFEMYANTIYFGSNYYGVNAAAQGYFGKTAAELTDAEAVMLAGLPNAPSAYSPDSRPDLARRRAQKVLTTMVRNGKLTDARAETIAAEIEKMWT